MAGYDLLNETVLDDAAPLNRYYAKAIRAIREVDRQHIIFIEGNRWAQDIACLQDFSDDNLVLGIHFYEPLEFTFNYIPGISYPLRGGKVVWDKAFMHKRLDGAVRTARRAGRPLWCGEFGVHARFGKFREEMWLKDALENFRDTGIHWHYWTWKAVKHHMFPDGVFSYFPNDPWVSRPGPLSGWETWHLHWPHKKADMIASWKTESFQENRNISKVLQHAARKDQ